MQSKSEKYFIGIDVGGTKVYGGLVTPAGTIAAHLAAACGTAQNPRAA